MNRTRSQKSSPARTVRAGLFGLATLSGCAALMPGGAHRSEQFASGNAPEPTVATTALTCVAKTLPPGSGDELSARFDALARAAMPAAPVPLSPAAHAALCNTVAASAGFHAWRETTPEPSAQAVIREIAQATGAKSVAIPIMRLYARCEQDTKTVRDSTGATIATIQENTQTCQMDRFKDVGLFLFAADGTILYRSTKQVGQSSRTDPEPEMNQVLANIPATFSAPAAGARAAGPSPAAAPAAVAYAPPAAPQGVGANDPKVDDAIGALNSKTPADCKKFVKAICHSTSIPDPSRLQMCTGYVTTVNQLVQQQGAKAADACKGMAKSAPQ